MIPLILLGLLVYSIYRVDKKRGECVELVHIDEGTYHTVYKMFEHKGMVYLVLWKEAEYTNNDGGQKLEENRIIRSYKVNTLALCGVCLTKLHECEGKQFVFSVDNYGDIRMGEKTP